MPLQPPVNPGLLALRNRRLRQVAEFHGEALKVVSPQLSTSRLVFSPVLVRTSDHRGGVYRTPRRVDLAPLQKWGLGIILWLARKLRLPVAWKEESDG